MKNIIIPVAVADQNRFEKLFDSVINKAKKSGINNVPTLSKGSLRNVSRTVVLDKEEYQSRIIVRDYILSINDTFCISGYRIIAEVHHKLNLVNVLDKKDIDLIPNHLGVENLKCECCGGVHGNRKKSYIVLNETTGNIVQIGSSCIDTYIPNKKILPLLNLHYKIVAILGTNYEMEDSIFGGECGGSGGYTEKQLQYLFNRRLFDVQCVVNTVSAVYSDSSVYVPKEYDEYNIRTNIGRATVDLMCHRAVREPNNNLDLLNEVRGWWDNKNPNTAFDNAKKEILNDNQIMVMDFHYIYFAVVDYLNRNTTSQFVGVVGSKEALNLTVIGIKTGYGSFGEWILYRFVDDNNNQFSKFGKVNIKFRTNDNNSNTIEINDKVSFVAEIKEHQSINDSNTTLIGRLSAFKR